MILIQTQIYQPRQISHCRWNTAHQFFTFQIQAGHLRQQAYLGRNGHPKHRISTK